MHKIVSVQIESLLKRYGFLSNKTNVSDDSELQKFVMYLEKLYSAYTFRFSWFRRSLTIYSKNGEKAFKIKRYITYLGNKESFNGIILFSYLTKCKEKQPFAGYGTLKVLDNRDEVTEKRFIMGLDLMIKENLCKFIEGSCEYYSASSTENSIHIPFAHSYPV